MRSRSCRGPSHLRQAHTSSSSLLSSVAFQRGPEGRAMEPRILLGPSVGPRFLYAERERLAQL